MFVWHEEEEVPEKAIETEVLPTTIATETLEKLEFSDYDEERHRELKKRKVTLLGKEPSPIITERSPRENPSAEEEEEEEEEEESDESNKDESRLQVMFNRAKYAHDLTRRSGWR